MTDRFIRQETLVPREKLQSLSCSIIGVGALGRQVALQLASLGVPKTQLIDFDVVEETNITTQGYLRKDLGEHKVQATARGINEIDPQIEVLQIADRYRPQQDLSPVVFCCVDSIASRAAIWRSARRHTEFWCDGRMLGEVMRIVTATDEVSREAYAETLFLQEEAEQGSCTSRGVIYTAAIAAGLMLHQFTRWLRGLPCDPECFVSLLSGEWITATPKLTPSRLAQERNLENETASGQSPTYQACDGIGTHTNQS